MAVELVGCDPAPSTIDYGGVQSLEKHYDLLLNEARSWKEDAYLANITLEFEAAGGRMHAGFQSPSDDFHSLLIFYDPHSGKLTAQRIVHEIAIPRHLSIAEPDWQIDSVDAMALFLDVPEIRKAWDQSSVRCNDLQLNYFNFAGSWRLAWALTITSCGPPVEYYFLDAKSGQRILTPQG
jgi:hypothetical protein